MRNSRRGRRTAAIAAAAASALALGVAPSAQAFEPENPPTCTIEPGPTMPCVPGSLSPYLHGVFNYSIPLSAATQTASGVAGDPGGTGTSNITFDFNHNKVCATTSWSGIDSPVVMAHIHQGAYGKPENPAVTISLFAADMLNGRTSPASGCSIVPSEVLYAFRQCPNQFNVVVHSQKHPVGAIRGQFSGCPLTQKES